MNLYLFLGVDIMSVSVKDIINLKSFQSHQIIAGENGLNNNVERVSFIDCPIRTENMGNRIVLNGDFFIGSHYIFATNSESLLEVINFYVDYGGIGLCMTKEIFNEHNISKKVIAFANENNFPIILLDKETPYADIIYDICKLIITSQLEEINKSKIKDLMEDILNDNEKLSLCKQLNHSMNSDYKIIYVNSKEFDHTMKSNISFNFNSIGKTVFHSFKNGSFIILNDFNLLENIYLQVINDILKKHNIKIGISETKNRIDDLGFAFKEAFSSYNLTDILDVKTVHYNSTGLITLLYEIKDTKIYKSFHDHLFIKLNAVDSQAMQLTYTITTYFENNGNIKNTAYMLNVHENTIRYRLQKLRDTFDVNDSDVKFNEIISLLYYFIKLGK